MKKVNTTAYYPQCDGLIKQYNYTLKTALRKHAARFGVCLGLCGHFGTLRMNRWVRNPRSSSLNLIAIVQQRLHSSHQRSWR